MLGLGLAVLVGFLMPDELAIAARVTAAVVVLMGTWWVIEAVPLPVTAMVPLIAFPATQVFPLDEVAGSYASEIIFLFLGGFLLARGIQRWNRHRRIAILIVLVVGTKPSRMILGLMMATAALGMWVCNTATALMMIPLGSSLVALVREEAGGHDVGDADSGHSQFGIGLMIAIAYAATFSACGSIIASPGNIFVVGYLQETVGYQVGFLQWMLFGIPFLIVFFVLGWLIITKVLFRPEVKDLPGGRDLFLAELKKLGPIGSGELGITMMFLSAAVSWIVVPVLFDDPWATDAVIAMIAGVATFVIPAQPSKGVMLMNWETELKTPWGVLILCGGG